MKITLNIFLIFILTIQCKSVEENNQSEKDWTKTQKSRKHFDYATFIQNHPKSEHFEKALSEYFFLRDSVDRFLVCGKYNPSISVADENKKVLFNDELTDLDSLKFRVFEYLKNGIPNVASLKYEIQIPKLEKRDSISRGHFDIVIYKKPFPLKSLKILLKEMSVGIHNYKKYLSKKWYKKPYNELTDNLKIEIDYLNDSRLSFFDFSYMNGKRIVPPPPPEFDNDKFQTEE